MLWGTRLIFSRVIRGGFHIGPFWPTCVFGVRWPTRGLVPVGRRGFWSPLADVRFGIRWTLWVLVPGGRRAFWYPLADVALFPVGWRGFWSPLADVGFGPLWPTWVLVLVGRRGFLVPIGRRGNLSSLVDMRFESNDKHFHRLGDVERGGVLPPPLSTLVTVGRRANGGGKMFIWTKNGSDPPHFHVGQTVKGISTPPFPRWSPLADVQRGGGIGPLPVPRRPICENVFFNVFRITHIGPWRLAYTRSPFLGVIVNFCTTDVEWFGFGML